jgi:hypothetical protein
MLLRILVAALAAHLCAATAGLALDDAARNRALLDSLGAYRGSTLVRHAKFFFAIEAGSTP